MGEHVIFDINGGIGKNIIATSVIKSIKSFYKNHKLIIVTKYPEVFINNPNIYRVYKKNMIPYFYEDFIKNKNSIILKMDPYDSGDFVYRKKHLAEIWCDIFNIPCIDTIPQIFLTQREIIYANNFINKDGPTLIVQTNGGSEMQQHSYSWERDLPISFAQDLINTLKPNFKKIIHIARENQLCLKNTLKIKDNLRNIFSYIAVSDSILGIDSFVQHAAAAFNKKATVGWIYNSPNVFGYNLHDNIIAKGTVNFCHNIDCYLEYGDWNGNKFYQCPYDNLNDIFKKEDFINSIVK